ncbi:YciI family protein [Salipiger thiooxidans]|uniref:YciI family protein n=1 Tax=Salipiger thiooxidans TaxID=282683 RepID=UPI001CD6D7B3|nr:YciI family protein [Salipiger thiooxidans]MCA0849123.1 YciI family protein [Salipiger thiooxidans]
MPRYLISFHDGAMDHIPPEDLPAVGEAARAVARDARAAGAWIFGGGLLRQQAAIVGTDGSVTQGPLPGTKAVLGGFSILELATRDEALHWAGRFAAACRCAQDVREIMYDPDS